MAENEITKEPISIALHSAVDISTNAQNIMFARFRFSSFPPSRTLFVRACFAQHYYTILYYYIIYLLITDDVICHSLTC